MTSTSDRKRSSGTLVESVAQPEPHRQGGQADHRRDQHHPIDLARHPEQHERGQVDRDDHRGRGGPKRVLGQPTALQQDHDRGTADTHRRLEHPGHEADPDIERSVGPSQPNPEGEHPGRGEHRQRNQDLQRLRGHPAEHDDPDRHAQQRAAQQPVGHRRFDAASAFPGDRSGTADAHHRRQHHCFLGSDRQRHQRDGQQREPETGGGVERGTQPDAEDQHHKPGGAGHGLTARRAEGADHASQAASTVSCASRIGRQCSSRSMAL